ncbi:DUF1206 domain-containing protein [Nocardioides sp.]|uniref:DUF1206 domain-containing protein n=1 Tax=Nocardioides sp. TaxID=35761 RepID=UPI002ED4DC7C
MTGIRRAAVEAEQSDVVDHAVRVGLVAYGVVHLLIAWLGLQIAFGETGKTASASGAMHTLVQQPLGEVLVWAVGIGFVILALWRVLEAWQAIRLEDGKEQVLDPAGKLIAAVVYSALAITAFQVAVGSSGGKGGGGGSTDSMTAQLMSVTAGQLLVGAVGLGILGYAGYLVHRGWTEKFLEELDGRHGRKAGKAYRWIGKIGHIGKGVAIALVGGLFVWAAVTHDPKKSGGLDQALQQLRDQPFGQVVLVAISVGLACYGLFAFVWARHLSR